MLTANDAYRLRYRDTDENSVPYFPEVAMTLDYYLPQAGEVSIEVYDAENNKIQSFNSIKKVTQKPAAERDMSTEFTPFGSGLTLSDEKGAHRVHWDLRHVGAWSDNAGRSGSGGPMVAPGTYTIKLMAGGKEVTQTAEVKADPRLLKSGVTLADLEAQEALTLQVRDLLSEVRKLDFTVAEKMEAMENAKKVNKKEKAVLESMDKELNTAEGRYMTPMLSDQTRYLYYMLESADQKPGKDAYMRYEELKKSFDSLKSTGKDYLEVGK
jgi:hypothetical protein